MRKFGLAAALAGGIVLFASPAAYADTPNTTINWSGNGQISSGGCGVSVGSNVVVVQTILAMYGYYNYPNLIDNYAGTATNASIRAYQSAHGLTVDGCVGSNTWSSLQGLPHSPSASGSTYHPDMSYYTNSAPYVTEYFDYTYYFGPAACVYAVRVTAGNPGSPVSAGPYYAFQASGNALAVYNPADHSTCTSN